MKRRLTIGACLLLASFVTIPVVLSQTKAKGQKAKVIDLKANKSTTRGEGEDPNVKSGSEANDPNAPTAAPENKGGSKTRGYFCEVRFDNRTPWIIKLFVDGNYKGAMVPYGDAVAYAWPGGTTVYARADFTDGSSMSWGPQAYDCKPNQYINFRMNP